MTQEVKASDGRRLSVESLGALEGRPVFLLHGTPGGRNGPRPRGIILYRLGIRLISYDRPGYPDSDRQFDRTVADAAIDVEAIADHFGIDRFSVVGRSGGAPHALACAALLKDRVICAAALGSLAPYDADGLTWLDGMTPSNQEAYRHAGGDLRALIAMLNDQAGQVRSNSESLLKRLWPDLADHDKVVIGNIAIRRKIAEVHAAALRDSADGWIDDVIALSRPWGFDPADITVPVLLWHGNKDVFSPIEHTYWLRKKIHNSELEVENGAAHFGAVEILPRILTWVVDKANAAEQANTESRAEPTAVSAAGAAG